MMTKIYPRTGDQQTVYLNAVIKDPQIEVGDYTIYNDFIADPLLFEQCALSLSHPSGEVNHWQVLFYCLWHEVSV